MTDDVLESKIRRLTYIHCTDNNPDQIQITTITQSILKVITKTAVKIISKFLLPSVNFLRHEVFPANGLPSMHALIGNGGRSGAGGGVCQNFKVKNIQFYVELA